MACKRSRKPHRLPCIEVLVKVRDVKFCLLKILNLGGGIFVSLLKSRDLSLKSTLGSIDTKSLYKSVNLTKSLGSGLLGSLGSLLSGVDLGDDLRDLKV